MTKAPKNKINVFGEESIASIVNIGGTFHAIRHKDLFFLASGKELKEYLGDIVITMYTGEKYAEGDYILESDRHGIICKFE